MVINSVVSVQATERPEVYILTLDITDRGETYQCQYVSNPDDPHGINPQLRQWLSSNSYTVLPYEVD